MSVETRRPLGEPEGASVVSERERRILARIDRGGMHIGEEELRYQLDCKERDPLARAPGLLDLLAELEERGLVVSQLHWQLTDQGRAELPADYEPVVWAGVRVLWRPAR